MRNSIRRLLLILLGILTAACGASSTTVTSPGASNGGAMRLSESTGRYGQPRLRGPEDARNAYAPVVAMIVPGYTFRVAGNRPQAGARSRDPGAHGFVWSLPFWIRDPAWRHGFAVSFAQYPEPAEQEGRWVYRARLVSAPAQDAILHLLLGLGVSYGRAGLGPRTELGWLLGRPGRGGALLLASYGYRLSQRAHVGELSVSAFIPYVIR